MTDRPSLTLRATVGPEYTTGGESSVWTRNFQTNECLSSYNSAFQELAFDSGVVNILPLSYVAR